MLPMRSSLWGGFGNILFRQVAFFVTINTIPVNAKLAEASRVSAELAEASRDVRKSIACQIE